MTDQKNLILAIVISVAILFGFHFFYELPRQRAIQEDLERQRALQAETIQASESAPAVGADLPTATTLPAPVAPTQAEAVSTGERIKIDTPRLHGTVNLRGGRIDDLTLADYKVTQDDDSPEVVLLSPSATARPYFAEFGWIPAGDTPASALPGPSTDWTATGGALTPDSPVTLTWDNGQGLVFERVVSVDRDYMFTVTQRVRNTTDRAVSLAPYGRVQRVGTPTLSGFFILHEGPIGVLDGVLREYEYEELRDEGQPFTEATTGGWIGFTDKYWLVSLIPDPAAPVDVRLFHQAQAGLDAYQIDYRSQVQTVQPGGSYETTHRLFAGAKQVSILDAYENDLGVTRFSYAVDWGWFYFLTKPFFYGLDFLGRLFGNFGIGILVFTVFLRLVFFPLANKQYESMAKMKKLQPKMEELKKRYGDDRQRFSEGMMLLYKQEKVNPLSGCLPILLQIPVFFALYKVLFVTIEMRHAPFFGWIQDLSAPDPTSLFNLFGLIPWDPPTILMIGVWPLLMGFTMWLQMKLNPAQPDPIQQKIFMILPFVFTFMMASFPAGLVIYWTWSNILSILQQWVIMRRMGVKIT